jgi:hypothetical protein
MKVWVILCNAPGDHAMWLVLFISVVALLSFVFVAKRTARQ